MATAQKGKKKGKQIKGSKGKKNSGNTSFFTKFILVILALSLVATAIFFTLNNFNINKTNVKNESNVVKTETVVKKEDVKKVDKPIEKPEVKTEAKTETSAPQKQETKKENNDIKETKQESKEMKTLNGCWLSSEQGAFITIDEYGYRIDFSNVDAGRPMTGNYFIENNLITFASDGNECEDDGTYRITFYKKNMSLSCKNDDCTDRRNVLEADWEWVEY